MSAAIKVVSQIKCRRLKCKLYNLNLKRLSGKPSILLCVIINNTATLFHAGVANAVLSLVIVWKLKKLVIGASLLALKT